VAIDGPRAHVTDYASGLIVLPAQCAGQPWGAPPADLALLGQNYPNPFTLAAGATVIRFVTWVEGPATLRLLDAAGRNVRVLLDGFLDRGEQVVRWDGRNERGEVAGSGVYFYRLDVPGYTTARRLVRIK
jgi:hypothetical protein